MKFRDRQVAVSSRIWIIFCAGVLVTSGGEAAMADSFRTVAFTDQPAPGTPDVFQGFLAPGLNGLGQTVFNADFRSGVGDATDSNQGGLWSEGGGSLHLVARQGAQAPGTPPGAVFDLGFSLPGLNSLGQTAFFAILRPGGGGVDATNNYGIWSEGGGSLALILRQGNHAPGTAAGDVFDRFFLGTPLFNNAGQASMLGSLLIGAGDVFGGTNNIGIWSIRNGSLQLVARDGDFAPASLGRFYSVNTGAFNDLGQNAFAAVLESGFAGVTNDNSEGIWSEEGGALHLVARQGSQAPGAVAGTVFNRMNTPVINNAGKVAFRALLKDGVGGVTTNSDLGIWTDGAGSLAPTARSGDHAPGTPAGATFADFHFPVLNHTGQVAFSATLRPGAGGVVNDNDTGLWSGVGNSLHLVAREGDQAPGADPGVSFFDFSKIVLNKWGQTHACSARHLRLPSLTCAGDFDRAC